MIDTLGHYKILERRGAGGIGDVYRARDTRLGRTVAVKVVRHDAFRDESQRRRLLEDARAAAALSHPHVAAFYEIGEQQGDLFLVSEYVPGQSLRVLVSGRPINTRRAIELAAQVADGLAQAHAHGMAHGDIRADNIVVTPKGSAKVMEPAFAAWIADPGHDGPATAATGDDIYDLGLVLFEMLTGIAPTQRENAHGVSAPSSLNSSLPERVDAVVGRMLAPERSNRFSSAAVAAAELRQVAVTLEDDEPLPVAPPGKNSTSTVWLVLILGLAIVVGLIWLAVNAG
ncbi:MAG: serine/threonine-protein kinase [Vicinamibacterales bacterium]